jgi:hypothetical protein
VAAGAGETLGNVGDMVVMMMVVMIMSLMMEQTRDLYEPAGTPPRPKPVSEAVAKGAREAAKYAGKGIKKVTEYFKEGEGD